MRELIPTSPFLSRSLDVNDRNAHHFIPNSLISELGCHALIFLKVVNSDLLPLLTRPNLLELQSTFETGINLAQMLCRSSMAVAISFWLAVTVQFDVFWERPVFSFIITNLLTVHFYFKIATAY
jgi:hypothetical protein